MNRILIVPAIACLMVAYAHAASVTHTFQSGDPALASEINTNFQDVVDAINAAGATTFGDEWFLAPSSTGGLQARNVIVLKEDRGGTTGGCGEEVYRVRVYFTNTGGLSVNNASGSVTPARIFITGFVCADRSSPTQVFSQDEYVFAIPSSGSFVDAQGVEINSDTNGDGTFDSNNAFDYSMTDQVNALANTQLIHSIEMYRDGDTILTANSFSSLMSSLNGPVAIGAPLNQTFNDVAVQSISGYTGNGATRIRVRAKDIGLIQTFNRATFDDPVFNNQFRASAIFYRIEGQGTAGSLANTPFATGGATQGIWFSQ